MWTCVVGVAVLWYGMQSPAASLITNYTCSTTKWTRLVVRAEIAVDAVLGMDACLRVPAFVVPKQLSQPVTVSLRSS